MITMNMYQKIRVFKNRGYSKRKISRELKIDRKTVRKYFEMSEAEYLEYQINSVEKEKIFAPFKDEILNIFNLNNNKIYTSSIYDVLEEKYGELPGTERTLRNYLIFLKKTGEVDNYEYKRIYTPVEELPHGKQLQLDFGETEIETGEKVYIFGVILSVSRFKYAAVQKRPFKSIDVINHLLDTFEIIGGVPEEIVIDQDKVMVVKENSGDIKYTKEFKAFKDEQGFKMYVCRKADPESKGKVENFVKFIKSSFFSARHFTSFDQIQEALNNWLSRRANGKICQATGIIPQEALLKEIPHFKKLKPSIFRRESIINKESREVNSKSLISVSSSFYSVPNRFRKKTVWIYQTDTDLFIYDKIDGEEIARHKISPIKGKKITKHNHFRNYDSKPDEVIKKLKNRFSSNSWKQYVDQNYKKYSRYYRDQQRELYAFINSNPDDKLIAKTADLCIENGTLSARNFEESYLYVRSCETENYPDILPQLLTGIKAVKHENKNIEVKKRDLSYYTSLVSLLGGAL